MARRRQRVRIFSCHRRLGAHNNLVLSLRQIGVPLAGMLAGLVMPPLTLQWGWRPALIAQMVPVLMLGAALEVVRRSWVSSTECQFSDLVANPIMGLSWKKGDTGHRIGSTTGRPIV